MLPQANELGNAVGVNQAAAERQMKLLYRFRRKLATESDGSWPLNPRETVHAFRRKLAME